jgi:hypothetical protein
VYREPIREIYKHPLVGRYMSSIIDDFIVHFVATILGATLGLGAAMWWDRRKKEEEIKHTRTHILDSLIEELKVVQEVLNDPANSVEMKWDTSTQQFKGSYLTVSTPAYDSAVNSGNFSLLSESLQTKIADVYLLVRESNAINEQILRFYTTPIYTHNNLAEREANKLSKFQNIKMSELRGSINELLSTLESAKKL